MSATALQFHEGSSIAFPLSISRLRRWLDGSWALLFSHGDDFAAYGFEADRWLAHVREAFASTGVRPLARVSGTSSHGAGWVTEIGGGCTTDTHIDEIRRSALRETTDSTKSSWLWDSRQRFVLLLNDALSARWSFLYSAGDSLRLRLSSRQSAKHCVLARASRRADSAQIDANRERGRLRNDCANSPQSVAAILRTSSAERSPASGEPGMRYLPFSSPPIRTGS